MVYVRQHNLAALRAYRYAGVDKSLVSRYVLKPFYTHVVIKCFPMSMAPNAITLTGFCFVVINFLTLLWYNPTLDQDCPPWVYLSWALGLFLYQTFDAVDGAQARRTRQSGPLGELFDHAALTFYVQTWDEYYTQTLTLGIISGPVEGILTLCAVYATTAIKGGASFWHKPMLATLGVPTSVSRFLPASLCNLPFTSWYIIYGAFVLLFSTLSSILNVMHVRRQRNLDIYTPLLGLLPAAAMWVLVFVYLHLRPLVRERHLVPFVMYVGLINAYSVGQMIIAHLVKKEFPYRNVLLLPLLVGVVDGVCGSRAYLGLWEGSLLFGSGNGGEVYQVALVFCSLGLAVGVYGSFVFDVITTICDYLDIWCLSIKYPFVEGAAAEPAKAIEANVVDTATNNNKNHSAAKAKTN
ncbi:aminoalcoholphosphotransferase [Histoplasma capsulatum G186AR]|uniref:Aminoalcoholphosphotransferase n=1 Tax=Ajellomyces capsulatus (strain G186AR / H82 / ATCC MYA-2454 / RMSCC 2432) TaxID=447093 RepID=C0NXQ9_AJECG|nr:aminoalcoholphosphotransferase [Histoplasma capsulatum G186AR]EEH03577.1 aminoalcoholphosphotransferase [Histoplasma capsulatum G186AR]